MKKIIVLFLVLVAKLSFAQEPAQWQFSIKKIKEGVYAFTAKAQVQRPWHIYSQTTPPGGPLPTIIQFTKHPLISLDEDTKELGRLISKREEVFGIDVKYYEGSVEFEQILHVKKKVKTNFSGTISYMLCNDSECLPPKKQSFSLAVQ